MVHVETTKDVVNTFLAEMLWYVWEVSKALLPILGFFILFQAIPGILKRSLSLKYWWERCILFLCGVNVGFMPAGYFIGSEIAGRIDIRKPGHGIMFTVPLSGISALFQQRVMCESADKEAYMEQAERKYKLVVAVKDHFIGI